ncbi:MAG: HEAT repeat domain-containing protein [Candidatus Riflebacteria bacterium]|nr:HEAT repeat domain-containing protein [Candidatus Riflebacteria bacterium]
MNNLLALLLEDLDSENRSVRCDAVRQLAEQDLDPATLARMNALAADPQQDPEIQFLARQAVLNTERRRRAPAQAFPAFTGLLDLERKLGALNDREFQQAVGNCPAESVPALMEVLRRLVPQPDLPPDRAAVVLAAFRRWGKPEDGDLLLPFVGAKDPVQVIEAIGALERLAPRKLFERIGVPLASPYPHVQNRALRTILRFHFMKGVDYLRRMFASEHASVRAAAVMQCMSIPFGKVQELVFNALAVEEDPRVLARAAYLLYLNPSENTVYWLMDIAGTASAAKGKWCQDCITAVLDSIRLSGIMEGSVEEFTARIRKQLESRQRNSLLGTFFEELQNKDPMRRYEAIEALREHHALPEVREKFQAMYLAETDKRVKGLLTTIFADNPDRERLQAEMAPEKFQKLLRDEQLALLGQVKSCEEFSFVKPSLQRFSRMRLDPMVVAEAVRLLGRFGDPKDDQPFLMMALKSGDGLVMARAIEGLGHMAPEILMKELPRLIREHDPTVRGAALRTFFRLDKAQAMKALQDMLLSESSTVKEQSLVCLAQLSYSATRPLLLRFLKEDPNMALVRKAGMILRNNPDPDAVRSIYQTMRLVSGPRKTTLQEILQDCIKGCIEAGLVKGTVAQHLETLQLDAAAGDHPTI